MTERRPNPRRITMALDVNGLEGPEVDVACGGVEPMVDEWEAGRLVPTPEQLELLAALTGFPLKFFFLDDPEPFVGFICDRSKRKNGCQFIDTRPDAEVVPLGLDPPPAPVVVNPTRITMALNLRGMRAAEVDQACGGDVQAWESGDTVPTEEELGRLVDLTWFPRRWFELPDADEPIAWLCDRTRRTLPGRGAPPRSTSPAMYGPYQTPCVQAVKAAPHEPADAGGWRPCGAVPTRHYLIGHRCQAHTPAALAGKPEPPKSDPDRRWKSPIAPLEADTALVTQRAIAAGKRRASTHEHRAAVQAEESRKAAEAARRRGATAPTRGQGR